MSLPLLGSLRQIHWSIYALALASGVIMMGFMMLLPLLPAYASDLGFSGFQLGVLVASFFIGRVLFEFPVGIISDRLGRRRIMWAALLLFTVTTSAYALTTEAAAMIGLRILQGAASAAFAVGSQAYINDRTPSPLRGLANGISSSAINIGVVVGPVISGILSERVGLQAPFWVGGALGGFCFIVILAVPRSQTLESRQSRTAFFTRDSLRKVLGPVLCLPAFALSLIHLLQWMGVAILLTAAPIFTADASLAWGPGQIAAAFAISGVVAAVTSPSLGQLSDRFGRIGVTAFGLGMMALEALIILAQAGTALTMLAFAIGGLGTPAYFNSFLALIGDVTHPEERGAVTGFVMSFGEWGSIIGSALLVPLLWRTMGDAAPLVLLLVVALLTMGLTLALRRPLTDAIGRARTDEIKVL